ncbi:hypothetical protein AB0O07_13110 [Streptomyces sp. NPDC093085]|uniref:hypothetical protein n=1 Tax=Streptomyces sp. NPDC093085 TaxID=3155068 RepID=UPI00342E937B
MTNENTNQSKNENDTKNGNESGNESGDVNGNALRRLLRNRTFRTAVVAALVGGLLGAGTVAWRTDTLPLLGPQPCWDSLSDTTVRAFFGDDRTVEAEEEEVRPDPRSDTPSYGQCRVTSFKGEESRRRLTIRAHILDGMRGDDGRQWPREFLGSGMVPLGDGLPGMASASRAWLALPQSCTGRPGRYSAPFVVDVSTGLRHVSGGDYEEADRSALADVLVEATNGVLRELDCSGTYRRPAKLPPLITSERTRSDALCGNKGFTLPAAYRESLTDTYLDSGSTGSGGPARVCELGSGSQTGARLITIEDPALGEIFSRERFYGGLRLRGTKGSGSLNETRALYTADCQTGPVVFLVDRYDALSAGDHPLPRDLIAGYVATEAERIGCGPEKVTLPPA